MLLSILKLVLCLYCQLLACEDIFVIFLRLPECWRLGCWKHSPQHEQDQRTNGMCASQTVQLDIDILNAFMLLDCRTSYCAMCALKGGCLREIEFCDSTEQWLPLQNLILQLSRTSYSLK